MASVSPSLNRHEQAQAGPGRSVSISSLPTVPIPNLQTKRTGSSNLPSTPNTSCMLPTWHGFIHTTNDALMILEGCLKGKLNHIPRRPHDRERPHIIASGNVFIYEENASGIKRWTDGVTWSPSRIMNNFLVYRELNEPFPAGEKKKAKKRKRGGSSGDVENVEPANGQTEEDRKLVGSLVDSYGFKRNGLIKKTLNIKLNGVHHHIVSYYNLPDVKEGKYKRPQFDRVFDNITIRPELVQYGWKAPIHDVDEIDPFRDQQPGQPSLSTSGLPLGHDSPQSSMNLHLGTESPVSYDNSPISYSGQSTHDGPLNPTHMSLQHPARASLPAKYNHPQYKSQATSHTSVPANYNPAQASQYISQASHFSSQPPQYPSQTQNQYVPSPVQYFNHTQTHHLPQSLNRHDSVQPSLNNHVGQVDYIGYNIPHSAVTNAVVGASVSIAPSVARNHQYPATNDFEEEYIDTWEAIPAPVSAPPPPKRRQTVPVGSVTNYGEMLHLGGGMESYGFNHSLQYGLHTPS